VVCADARLPNVEELGLDHAGVQLGDDGRVTVDQQQRTSAAGIYAAVNVTGPPWLTNQAVAAGDRGRRQRARGNRTGPRRAPASVGNTRPPLAAVGLTAEQATATGRRVATPTADLSLSARAAILGEPRGALKLVVDQDTQEILGAHMVGPESSEVIAQVVLAMEAGIGYRQLLRPHHLHPSMAEVGWPGHPLGRPRQECVIDARPNGASGALDRSPALQP
jgi:pyruvate/2-oxoglutarate dehydrogenase complex dihydrolipoamide dehydrogenase (E3) component